MKKSLSKLPLVGATIIAFAASFATAPKKFLPHRVFAIRHDGNVTFTNSAPSGDFICGPYVPYSCTLSTTATAAFFNTNFSHTFPPQSTTHPIVVYLDSDMIYQ